MAHFTRAYLQSTLEGAREGASTALFRKLLQKETAGNLDVPPKRLSEKWCPCLPSSVKVMAQRLDPEGLGIVLLYAFMEEFYPKETSSVPDVFTVWHYNGLSRSNAEAKVPLSITSSMLNDWQFRCPYDLTRELSSSTYYDLFVIS